MRVFRASLRGYAPVRRCACVSAYARVERIAIVCDSRLLPREVSDFGRSLRNRRRAWYSAREYEVEELGRSD